MSLLGIYQTTASSNKSKVGHIFLFFDYSWHSRFLFFPGHNLLRSFRSYSLSIFEPSLPKSLKSHGTNQLPLDLRYLSPPVSCWMRLVRSTKQQVSCRRKMRRGPLGSLGAENTVESFNFRASNVKVVTDISTNLSTI
jgi:hypothetical protein